MENFLLEHIRAKALGLASEAPKEIHTIEMNYFGPEPKEFAVILEQKFQEYRKRHPQTQVEISGAGSPVYVVIRKNNQLANKLYREMVAQGMAAKRRR